MLRRKTKTEYRTNTDGTEEQITFYWYECPEGHTGDNGGYCYDCAHLDNNRNPNAHSFYAKYGLKK
jgi:hypothetical protein